MSCGVVYRCGSDPALLWLGCRPAAAAPLRPLAWELPYATGAALKRKKQKQKNKKLSIPFSLQPLRTFIILPISMNLPIPPPQASGIL